MTAPLRRFRPTFKLQRIAYDKLDMEAIPSTMWLRNQPGHRREADEMTSRFVKQVEAEVAETEDKISKLTGQAEHLLAHLGYRPERRDEFADQAETLLSVLVDNLRKLVPRTDSDTPLP